MKHVSRRELAQIVQRRGWTLVPFTVATTFLQWLPARTHRDSDPWKSAAEKGIASLTDEDRRAARGRFVEP